MSGPCTQLAGGTSTGLVYPFDFPDPSVILVGQTYFAYATNSVAGNIQIIDSNRPDALERGRKCIAEPSRLGDRRLHLGPRRRHDRRVVRPLLRGERGRNRGRVHLRGDRHAARGAISRQVDGAVGMSEVAGRFHRPGVVHRHQRHALPGLEVRRPGLVEDLVPAARPVRHVVRPRQQSDLAARAGPAMGGRDRRSPEPDHHGRALLPLLLGQRLEQLELRGGRRHVHGTARSVQRCVTTPDSVERARRRRARWRVGVRRHGGKLLDRVPRLGPGRRGIPQQP